MIRVHCTKKLMAKLPVDETGRLKNKRPSRFAANDGPESPLSGWHANLILLQRRQCVLFVHNSTRFPVLITALKKPDFAELDRAFDFHFMNTLLKTGASDDLMQQASALTGPLVCDTVCNRSVQGTLNRMAFEIEHTLWYYDANVMDLCPHRMSAKLADEPFRGKDLGGKYVFPDKAMHALIPELGGGHG